jgi:hypothetical protein
MLVVGAQALFVKTFDSQRDDFIKAQFMLCVAKICTESNVVTLETSNRLD